MFLQPDNSIHVLTPWSVKHYERIFAPFGPRFYNSKLTVNFQSYMDFWRVPALLVEKHNIADILLDLELVQSRSWCRKNNWNFELTSGYQEYIFGSRRIKLCILMPSKRK